MTRMNPEWHKPDHDNPNGRSKMRWLVLGYMQDGDGENKDAPRATKSLLLQLGAGIFIINAIIKISFKL